MLTDVEAVEDEPEAARARALSELQHAAALSPANVRVLVAQAEVMAAEEAEEVLERAYCLAPGDARVVTALAEVCLCTYLCVLVRLVSTCGAYGGVIRLVYTCGARGGVTAPMYVCAHHTSVYAAGTRMLAPNVLVLESHIPTSQLGPSLVLRTELKTGYESGCLYDLSTVGKGCGGLGKTYFYSMCGQVLLAAGGPARAPRRARATRMLEDAATRRHLIQ